MDVLRITSEFAVDPKFPTSHVIAVYTASRVWYLCAESSKAQSLWMSALTSAIPYRGSFSSLRESATASFGGSESDNDAMFGKDPRRSSETGATLPGPVVALSEIVEFPPHAIDAVAVSSSHRSSHSSVAEPSVAHSSSIASLAQMSASVVSNVDDIVADGDSKPVVVPFLSTRVTTVPLADTSSDAGARRASGAKPRSYSTSEALVSAHVAEDDDFADVEAALEEQQTEPSNLTEEDIEVAARKAVASMGIEFPLANGGTSTGNVFTQLQEDRKRKEAERKEAEARRLAAMTPEERAAFEAEKERNEAMERRKTRRSMVQLGAYTSKADLAHSRPRGGKRK